MDVDMSYNPTFFNFGNIDFFNCSYFTKIMTRKPKIVNLTKVTELYPFLESKKWYMLFKEVLWSRDLLVKTINCSIRSQMINALTAMSEWRLVMG